MWKKRDCLSHECKETEGLPDETRFLKYKTQLTAAAGSISSRFVSFCQLWVFFLAPHHGLITGLSIAFFDQSQPSLLESSRLPCDWQFLPFSVQHGGCQCWWVSFGYKVCFRALSHQQIQGNTAGCHLEFLKRKRCFNLTANGLSKICNLPVLLDHRSRLWM